VTMHRTILLRLFVVIFTVNFSPEVLSQNTDSLKCWSSGDRLNWRDFRGKKPEDPSVSYLKAISSITIIPLPCRKNGILSYQFKLLFKKYESWKTDTADYLLAHEQLHFDIAELSVRKLRKVMRDIMERKSNPTSEDFFPVIDKLYAESANMHTAYDDDTAHGIIAESQAQWQKKVSLELKQLKDYASTVADCK
jgi:hypothetical protein